MTVPKDVRGCKHGALGYCGLCWADQAPKCKHGNPGACGFCIGDAAKPTHPLDYLDGAGGLP